jgi:hypothetical protein
VKIEGTDDLQKIADALKDADKETIKKVRAALRNAGKPLGRKVLERGAAELPHRGGLSAKIAALGRVGVSSALGGRVATISVVLRMKGADLSKINQGNLRHPVFGNRAVWVGQPIRPGAFRRAFDAEAEEARKAALAAAQQVLDDVARSV